MYKELFVTGSKNNPYIKIEAPAKSKAIARAEAKLKCSFPDDLKAYLSEINGDGDLFFSAERIVTENLSVRSALAECYPDLDQYLFVAGNGCGDYYGYRITGEHVSGRVVLFWDHETNAAHTVADSLAALIKLMYIDQVL